MPRTAGLIRDVVRTARARGAGPSAVDVRAATAFVTSRARERFEKLIDAALQNGVAPYGNGPNGRRHVLVVPLVDLAKDFGSGNEPELEAVVRATMADGAASQQLLAAVKAKLAEGGFSVEIAADDGGALRAFISDPLYVKEFFPDEAFDHGDVALRLEGKYECKAFGHRVAVINVKKGEALAVKSAVDAREPGKYRVAIWSHAEGSEKLVHGVAQAPANMIAADAFSSSKTDWWIAPADSQAIVQLDTPPFEKGHVVVAPDRLIVEIRRFAAAE